MLGITWATKNGGLSLAQTGFVFGTADEADAAGYAGQEWFDNEGQGMGEVDSVVGQRVDWLCDSSEKPTGFYVDVQSSGGRHWVSKKR